MDRAELLKIAKPILFNTEMVQAILQGRKTVTRRVIKSYPKISTNWNKEEQIKLFAKYKAGDYLYVRETFCIDPDWDFATRYKADYDDRTGKDMFTEVGLPWKPSIHMPKEAARIFLKVQAVRVEQLRYVTDEQAKMEGFRCFGDFVFTFSKIYPEATADSWVWAYEFEREKDIEI